MIEMKLEGLADASDRKLSCTVIGDPGVGKTSMGALFPKPVFMRVEDGLASLAPGMDVKTTPLLTQWKYVKDWLDWLHMEDHDRQTLVVDTVSALDVMLEAELVGSDNAKSLNQAFGGYGAGQRVLAGRHREFRQMCAKLGMHVVFLAHSDITTFKPEDDEPFNRLTMKMNGKSMGPYIDDVDVVGVLRLERVLVKKGSQKVAGSSGMRELVCHANVTSVAKNRLGVTKPMRVKPGSNPLWEMFSGERVVQPEKRLQVVDDDLPF